MLLASLGFAQAHPSQSNGLCASYHLLEAAESIEDHTACSLAAGMEVAFDQWDLKAGILSAAVTDNAKTFPWQLNN